MPARNAAPGPHPDRRSLIAASRPTLASQAAAGVMGNERGIRASKWVESELARVSRLYAALTHLNEIVVTAQTREVLFEEVCRVLGEHGGFRMCWIGWHVADTHEIVPVASWGDDSGFLRSIKIFADDRAEAHGPTGTAFREARPYVSNRLLEDPASLPWRPELARRAFLSSPMVPIREGNIVRGVLAVYADEVDFFQEREIRLLEQAAKDLSFGLANLARETARRGAEETLRQERDFSNAVIHSLPGILYLFDTERRFLRWNQNFETVTGYSRVEIAAMHPLSLFAGETRERVAARIAEVFEGGEAAIEAGVVAKDGTVIPYYLTGTRREIDGRQCLVGIGIDISERLRAEAAERSSDARYRTLFQCAPDGILIADSDTRILDANASVCRMLGYLGEELTQKSAADIVVHAEVFKIEPALRHIMSAASHHHEWELRRKDGSAFPADVIATLMPDGNVLAMIRDISARRQSERALRELNETLESKVEARTHELHIALVRAEAADTLKSAFLATMSHELRTPLNSIIGFTGILLQEMAGPTTPEQKKQLGMVRGSARHLLALINDVLDISKIEADQLEVYPARFGMQASIEGVLATVAPLCGAKGLTMTTAIDPAIGEILSDRRRVEQILLNLVNNAIKFTERGGVTVTATRSATAIAVHVADSGCGIEADDLATLFTPFRQLDTGLSRKHEGTGLGLAICRRLASLLGGEILVASTVGQGSTFTLSLPAGDSHP